MILMTTETAFELYQTAVERRNEALANGDSYEANIAQSDVDELQRALSFKLTLGHVREEQIANLRREAN